MEDYLFISQTSDYRLLWASGVVIYNVVILVLLISVYPPMPPTLTPEYNEYLIDRMIKQGVGPITGISSRYDFEKKEWK